MNHSKMLVMAAAFIAAPTAHATELYGANIAGAGGAAVAHPADNASITVNPGMLGTTKRYDVGGAFAYGPSADLFWGVSVLDSHTNDIIAFAFAYTGTQTNPTFLTDELPGWTPADVAPTNLKSEHGFTIAVNKPLWDRRIGLGISGTLIAFNREHVGSGTTGNMDVGIGFRPLEYLSVGFVGENFLPVPT